MINVSLQWQQAGYSAMTGRFSIRSMAIATLAIALFVNFAIREYYATNWNEYIEWKNEQWQRKKFSPFEILWECALTGFVWLGLTALAFLALRAICRFGVATIVAKRGQP